MEQTLTIKLIIVLLAALNLAVWMFSLFVSAHVMKTRDMVRRLDATLLKHFELDHADKYSNITPAEFDRRFKV